MDVDINSHLNKKQHSMALYYVKLVIIATVGFKPIYTEIIFFLYVIAVILNIFKIKLILMVHRRGTSTILFSRILIVS